MMGFDLLVIMPPADIIMLRHCLLNFFIIPISIQLLVEDLFDGSVVIPANIMRYSTGFNEPLLTNSCCKG
jgi:hypothetical protein